MLSYLTLSNLISLLKLILDIGVVSIVIYYCLKIIKNNTRTIQIAKGIIFVFLINWIAQTLELRTIEFLTTQFLNWGFLAVFIIFQPELRSLLEKLGRTTVFSSLSSLDEDQRQQLVDELVKTCITLSKSRTGALISLEQTNSLEDYIRTGTIMNSDVTAELLCSIFVPGTPLHDGAVIIRGNKIACASAYFPPTVKEFPSNYGARHRAAVGISEITDCVTIVVSEETGNISIAQEGKLTVMNADELRVFLLNIVRSADESESEDASDFKKETIAPLNEEKPSEEKKKKRKTKHREKIKADAIVINKTKSTPKKGGKNDAEK
ncbi:uncharacterized protein (TIGR00159 family) [Breznakia sp. PF5-3]|uniref:diadenylate cyclase CdaA n=1 Tax=unclassified Breznakia TaxID=2623764 RepID=UPI002406C7B8|nr:MULTISPECIES: diadenylate cyclase CdaA [unclassified Breznakia]MDF9825440.1 uncharacterized protein (TIGR00159 family) [Breznakia sp. PM6-1]MDF9836318.1 uncharacterized protein (TIGR00159 family) [Breznakia sp. PF5-3]